MGNRLGICGGLAAQSCVDECARLQLELEGKSRDAEDPVCDPAGAVFPETLKGVTELDHQALRFAGTSNLAAVRWLIAMGSSPNARDRNGTTLLHAACRSGSWSIVKDLMSRGLSLDSVDSAGWTPLHISAVMGRREISLLLLQAGASAHTRNQRGWTALDLCNDPGTKEVIREFLQDGGHGAYRAVADLRPAGGAQANDVLSFTASGCVRLDESSPSCEPFFVPRSPLFHDEGHRQELTHLGIEMFSQSAGHGLAFFVASGVVHDHPTDVSSFLVKHRVDPVQLGAFLGEDFSLAQTLRLAFIHAVDLFGVGVVGALSKSFQYVRVPADLQRVDRLTSSIAHLWWRMHDLEDCGDAEGEDPHVSGQAIKEVGGLELRRSIRTVEGLRRLMFSTVMLAWSLHGGPENCPRSTRPLSLSGWLDINSGIEADGSDIPMHAQRRIYERLVECNPPQLLPSQNYKRQDPYGPGTSLGDALSMQDASTLVKGWAVIPRGGIERQELANPGSRHGRQLLTQCILSETSGLPGELDQPVTGLNDGETVWLSLRFSFLLFLSTSPGDYPYAFVRLQDAVLREVRQQDCSLILAGRLKGGNSLEADDCRELSERGGGQEFRPFGDARRYPLPLCFVLADGRFQRFEAVWLELVFKTEEDVALWSRELGMACDQPMVDGIADDDDELALGSGASITRTGQTRIGPRSSGGPSLATPRGPQQGDSRPPPSSPPRAGPRITHTAGGVRRGPSLPTTLSPTPSVMTEESPRDFEGPRPAG